MRRRARFFIEFPAENDFAFRAVQKPDVQAELAQALRREAHGDIPFELRKGGASASDGLSPPPRLPHLTHPHR